MVFHVLNRGVGRMELFSKEKDSAAFEALLEQTRESRPMRICAYCLMPNHWHFVLWPEHDGELAAFMQQLTTKHVRRWQLHRRRAGYGHVYQSRYKSFPVEEEEYFYQLVQVGQQAANRGRHGGDSSLRGARPALRK
jgi:putative transposase